MGSKAREKAEDIKSNVQDKAEDVTSDAKDFVQEKTNQTTQGTHSGLKNAALGKYLEIDIFDQDNEIIASAGDLVTQEILTEAQENDQLDLLLDNLSKKPINL